MRVWARLILLAAGLSAVALASHGRQPGSVNGSYKVVVAGYYTGSGVVAVGGPNVNINVAVEDPDGNKGRLKAHLDLIDNRLHGTGEVMGRPMRIEGRIDPADLAGEQLQAQRIFATFGDDNGRHGRLAGSPKLGKDK